MIFREVYFINVKKNYIYLFILQCMPVSASNASYAFKKIKVKLKNKKKL